MAWPTAFDWIATPRVEPRGLAETASTFLAAAASIYQGSLWSRRYIWLKWHTLDDHEQRRQMSVEVAGRTFAPVAASVELRYCASPGF